MNELDEFLHYLKTVKSYSKNTILSYKRDLKIFKNFEKKKKDFSEFYKELNKKKLAPKSQARIISSIRSFFKFKRLRGKKDLDLSDLKAPRFAKRLPKVVYLEDFEKILKSSKETKEHKTLRNELCLYLLFGLGLRVSELTQIDLFDFHETESCLLIKGKGNKQRLLPLTDVLRQKIISYQKLRDHFNIKDKKALILNNKGNRLSRVDLWRWLKKWSFKAGFKKVLSCHQFRHGCATSLLNEKADLRSIQTLLGHSSIQSTEIYTSVSSDSAKRLIDEHHILSKKNNNSG